MAITRSRLEELERAERELKKMKKRTLEDEGEIEIEDEEPEVHFSSGKSARMGNKLPAKMMPVQKKKKWLGLRSVEDSMPNMEELQRIKSKVTEESPEIMFQKWLEKKCKRGCHLCEECVQEIEAIIES